MLHMDVLTSWTIWLMGVPIGLKLNNGLASFLGTVILTILKLWNVFTSYGSLLEGMILVLISFCGVLGCTSLIAMMHDILLFVVPHVWLLYSFFSRLHQGQMYVSKSLWYLFRGKKNNRIRKRVDTLDSSLDQQLVGTILFACVLFLSLTPFVFYCFWGSIWLSVLCVHALLWFVYSFICTLPLYEMYLYMFVSRTTGGGATTGSSGSMLPGSIRFTVSQYDVTRRNEESSYDRSYDYRHGNSGYNDALYDNDDRNYHDTSHDTSYLHLNGNSVGLTTLFSAFGTYFKAWSNYYSLVKFVKEFLSGSNITPMTKYHAHLDYHLYRTEMAQRNKALPPMKDMWRAIQTLLKSEEQVVESEEE